MVLYIALVVPVIWITELNLLEFRVSFNVNGSGSCPSKFITWEEEVADCTHIVGETLTKVTPKELVRILSIR